MAQLVNRCPDPLDEMLSQLHTAVWPTLQARCLLAVSVESGSVRLKRGGRTYVLPFPESWRASDG